MGNKSQDYSKKTDNDGTGQLKAGVYISYASTIMTILIQLVYTPIMIRVLGQSEYGLYSLVASVVSYLSLFNLGLTGAYLRFYSRYRAEKNNEAIARLNGMFLVMFTILASIAFTCGMILSCYPKQIFGDRLNAVELRETQILMRILVLNIALTFPSGLFYAVVDANEKFIYHRCVDFMGVIMNPFLTLPLLLTGHGNVAVVIVTTVVTLTKLLMNITYCCTKLKMKFRFNKFDFGLLKEIGAFSFFLFLNILIEQLNWNIDKVVLGHVAGTAVVAIYSVGSQMNMVFIDFLTTVSIVFSPRINRIAAEGDYLERYNEIFVKVGRIQFFILGLLVSGFVFLGKYFITRIYVGPEYEQSYIVTLLLLLPETIALIQSIGVEMQRALNKHQFRSIVYLIMSILNVIISIPLAKKWGAVGSAFGTTMSLLVAHGIIMNIYYRKGMGLDVKKFWKNIISMSKAFVLPLIMGGFIMLYDIKNIWEFLIAGVIYTVCYLASMWFFGLSDDEKRMLIKKRKVEGNV